MSPTASVTFAILFALGAYYVVEDEWGKAEQAFVMAFGFLLGALISRGFLS